MVNKTSRQDREIEILVVEDSPTQAAQLCYLLEENGYSTMVATNGRLALEKLQQRLPTLVISDIVMPEMDGYAMCRAIKSDAVLKGIPVIMVTSLAGIQDIARSLECGADSFIRKPYDPKGLIARVEYTLLNQELRQGQQVPASTAVYLEGEMHTITSGREQITDLLIATYAEAVHMNEELQGQQREIARSNQSLAGLYRIADELNRVSTVDEVCAQALAAALEMPRFEAGWIYLAEGESGCRLAAAINLPTKLAKAAQAGDCTCWQRFIRGGPTRGTTLIDCPALQESPGQKQHANIPLCINDKCLGVINLVATVGEEFRDDDLKMLNAIGNQVAVALERARLYQHLETLVAERTIALQAEVFERRAAEARVVSLNRVYAVLSEINSLIVRAHARAELFDGACRIAVDLGGFGLAWIGVVDPQSFTVKPAAWHGSAQWPGGGDECPAIDNFEILSSSPLSDAVRGGKAVVCRDLASASDVPFSRAAVAHGYTALAAFPLVVGTQPVGLFVLYSQGGAVFDDAEMRLLEELAGDISFALDHLAKAEHITYLAYYDTLTGLPNRDLLIDRLSQAIGFAQRSGRQVAVICIDLDRFKIINDGLGHNVGDRLLTVVGERLGSNLRDGDTAGRLAADKFALVCSDLADEDMAPLLKRIHAALKAPITVGENDSFHVTASLGVSRYPRDAEDPATLIKYADLAMCEAKTQGGNRHEYFTAGLDVRVTERLHVENRLGMAMDKSEFEVFYQPQVDAMSGRVNGMEALVRWHHPEFGLVPPTQFIPLAEKNGLIIPLGEWVLQQACRQNRLWQEAGLSDFPISVNLSTAQFREDSLLAAVRRILDETGLDPHALELEVTESLVMHNAELFIGFLSKCREMGVQIAIDDFGTGYSSLSYLRRLPLDRLKVDGSFVRDITVDPSSASICRAVISIAHNLRLGVVAEGVETEAQALYLARHACDQFQGYLYARPQPAEEITAMLVGGEPLGRPMPEFHA